jgi:membrane associated rhomboid family serine protease
MPPKDDLPSRRPPLVTLALVAVNLGAFAWQVLGIGVEASVRRGGAIPYEILTFQDVEWRALVPPPLTLLLALWAFGIPVERALGAARFLGLYLAAGVVAALAQTLAAAVSGDVLVPMVGASGAIAGVLAASVVLFPRARVLSRVPAGLLVGAWFLLQILSVVLGSDPGIAFMAHVGGFVAGLLLVRLLGGDRGWRARHLEG